MGTEIQANAFFSKNYHVNDLNGNVRNGGVGSLFQNNQTRRNGQDLYSLMSGMYQNGLSVYDIDKMRQTILKHETIFRSQLQELHRLHRRQRDLMSETEREASRATLVRSGDALGNSFKSSHLEPNGLLRNSLGRMDRGLFCKFGLTSGKTGNEQMLGHSDKRRVVEHSGTRDIYSAKSAISSHSLLGEPQNELLSSTFEAGESLFKKKRKIFGVEIYEVNSDSFNVVSNTSSTVRRNDSSSSEFQNSISFKQNREHVGKNLKDDRSSISLLDSFNGPDQCADVDFENTKGILPWFLRNHQSNGEPSKGINGSYFMNLDSLQNSSQNFFKKAEIADDSVQSLKEKEEISTQKGTPNVEGEINEISNKIHSTKKIFGFPISDTLESKKDENDPKNQLEMKNLDRASHLRLQIDLNLSLYEEDAPSAPSLPETIVKIATTEIDMEAPSVNESESIEPEASKRRSEISYEECDKRAADALVCIATENNVTDKSNEPSEPKSINSLEWFAELILSQCGEEDTIPEGMDDFEFMTLKLKDMKDECYSYSPIVMTIESDREKAGRVGVTCEGSRNGRARRRRRQRDFKKEIPGLVTLSRHEMKEDLKAFEEIRKGESRKRCSPKKGKGKKRSVSPVTQHRSNEMNLEVRATEGSLVGWGKKTRRLPRQRCPNTYRPDPVKC